MTSFQFLLLTSCFLFSVGLLTVMMRRNMIIILMGVELMLNAANLLFVTFSRHLDRVDGQVQVFFIVTVAAAEAAVGLSILLNIYRNYQTVRTEQVSTMGL